MSWLYKNRDEVIFSIVAFFILNLSFYSMSNGYCIQFRDTDDYMRLVRMRELFKTCDWGNFIIARCNVPFGCDLHWTRLYDFFWIPFVYIANFFTHSVARSVELTGCIISPIMGAVAIVVFLRIMHLLYKDSRSITPFIAAIIFSAHPFIHLNLNFCRPDHHSFIILFMLLYLLCAALLTETQHHKKTYICMAIIGGCNVWISPETLIPLLIIDAILFINSLIYNDKQIQEGLYIKSVLTACFVSVVVFSSQILIGIFLALLISSGLLIKYDEQKTNLKKRWETNLCGICFFACAIIFPTICPPEYDKISIVHLMLYLYASMFFVANLLIPRELSLKQRIFEALKWGIILGAGFLATYPKFLYGMGADVSEYIKRIWMDHVAEMRSPLSGGLRNFFIAFSFVNLVASITKITKLSHRNRSPNSPDGILIWYIIITLSLCYNLLAAFAIRMFPYAVIFALPIVVDFCTSIQYTKKYNSVPGLFITILFTIALPFFTIAEDPSPKGNKSKPITKAELYKIIDNLDAKPCVIMAHSNDGPAILYFTKHKVVGAPYHRQQQGIGFSYEVMENDYDEDRIKKILKFVDADYIFARNPPKSTSSKNSLEAMMLRDEKLPDWLEKIPCECKDIAIAKVLKGKL